mgnify:CR=1 FL=1
MEEYKLIEEIYQTIETHGLMVAIEKYFGVGARIQLPFSESSCNTEIEKLDLSVRSYNCLKRAGLHTVNNVIDAMNGDSLWKIRNLGKNSRAEIHLRIYEFGYYNLSEKWRKDFVKTMLELNRDNIVASQ